MRSRNIRSLVCGFYIAAAVAVQAVVVDGHAARVNRRAVLQSDAWAAARSLLRERAASASEAELQSAYRKALDALIEQALIVEEFRRQGRNVPEAMLEKHVSSLLRERFENDSVAFLTALAEERMTPEEWREQVRDVYVANWLRNQEVGRRLPVSPRAIRDYYERHIAQFRTPAAVHLRMIWLNRGATPEEDEAQRSQAQKVRELALAGEDFAALAQTRSEGPKADRGGDLGWLQPTELRAEFLKAIEALAPGEISEVVETPDGFCILKVEGRRAEIVRPFEEVRAAIANELRLQEEEQRYKAWIERLRQRSYVKVFDER